MSARLFCDYVYAFLVDDINALYDDREDRMSARDALDDWLDALSAPKISDAGREAAIAGLG